MCLGTPPLLHDTSVTACTDIKPAAGDARPSLPSFILAIAPTPDAEEGRAGGKFRAEYIEREGRAGVLHPSSPSSNLLHLLVRAAAEMVRGRGRGRASATASQVLPWGRGRSPAAAGAGPSSRGRGATRRRGGRGAVGSKVCLEGG